MQQICLDAHCVLPQAVPVVEPPEDGPPPTLLDPPTPVTHATPTQIDPGTEQLPIPLQSMQQTSPAAQALSPHRVPELPDSPPCPQDQTPIHIPLKTTADTHRQR